MKKNINIFGHCISTHFLSACNEQTSDSFEELEEEKDIDHYGYDTELLDSDSEMTLKLFGEEKTSPADCILIDDKIVMKFPSDWGYMGLRGTVDL